MKKFQMNFTTPEQSKRLLELGVPADSADCLLIPIAYSETKKETIYNEPMIMRNNALFSHYGYQSHKHMEWLPCWSAGRLMEIISICYTGKKFYYRTTAHKVAFWVERIECWSKIGFMNFSELEEQS